jgi:hypothetical protein
MITPEAKDKEQFFYTFPPVKEINILMAKFMGMKWDDVNEVLRDDGRKMSPQELRYDTSYNKLMPVIEQIQCQFGENLDFKTRINGGYGVLKHCAYITVKLDPDRDKEEKEYFISSSDSHIETIYRVAYQFIEWYNKRRRIKLSGT